MKKRLILHIGSPKTGTTSIQWLLHQKQDILREHGINFSRTHRKHISHNRVVPEFREGRASEFCDQLAEEIETSDCPLHIVSSELFFRPAAARMMAPGLAEFLPPALREATTVVCYLRRHDLYLEALYKQLVKNGKIVPAPQAFIETHLRRITYSKSLTHYAAAFGQERMVVRPFERQAFPGGDVTRDFADLAGIPRGIDLQLESDGSMNRTLSAELTELLGNLAQHSSLNTQKLIRDIIELGHDCAFASNDVYDRQTRRDIVDRLADDDAELNRLYGCGKETFFSRDDLAGADDPVSISDYRDRWHEASRVMAMALAKQLP